MPEPKAGRDRRMRVALIGLGTASTQIVPEILSHPNLDLASGCDTREEARDQFTNKYGLPAYATVAEMVADPGVDAVYVASPNRFHCEHVTTAAEAGKEVIVEKPMALSLDECDVMIDACDRNDVRLLAGHTHSFDAPIVAMSELIRQGVIGDVYMLHNFYYTDWLFRGRLPEELDTELGGGTVYRQGPHSVDIVRLLAGSPAKSVRAVVSTADDAHPTEGGFVTLMTFESGAVATIVFSGYAYFDSSELTFGYGEAGAPRSPSTHADARRLIGGLTPAQEARYKDSMRFGGDRAGDWMRDEVDVDPALRRHPFYGLTVVSGTKGDLRQYPEGVRIYGAGGVRDIEVPMASLEREAELDVLYKAWRDDTALPSHDGRWAKASLEVLLAIRESSRTGREIQLSHQVGPTAH
ncbi:Gfo/Idh/MocA family protein [Dactylosporangium sp. CA-092794]|uniref:Gfo/Idh/MocA family protein n=1 Tax=Dactylosporangium sp. CA-092794 TaxID=3239929 RepID=UPI003D89BC3E